MPIQIVLFGFILLEHYVFHVQVVERIFGKRNLSKSVLAFTKVHIIGAGQFVQGCCSVVCHFRINFVVWRSEKKNNFSLEKRVNDEFWKTMSFGEKQTGIFSQFVWA